MDRLRALGARYFDLDRFDRFAVAACSALAMAAVAVVATSAPPLGAAVANRGGDGPVPAELLTGLALSKQLATDNVIADRRDESRLELWPDDTRTGASGRTLLIALPIGIWLGFAAARRRPTTGSHRSEHSVHSRDDRGDSNAAMSGLQRSLRRRDRRIATLKRRLKAAPPAAPAEPAAPPDTVARLEHELEEAGIAIRRLEDLLQDKQDDWARSELVTARSDSRIEALEADLKAAGEIIEGLHEDIGYWKRRAVQTPRDADVIDRLTG